MLRQTRTGSFVVSAGGGGITGEEGEGVLPGTAGWLTGGAAIAMCLEANYWLTHLDLSWNKVGGKRVYLALDLRLVESWVRFVCLTVCTIRDECRLNSWTWT